MLYKWLLFCKEIHCNPFKTQLPNLLPMIQPHPQPQMKYLHIFTVPKAQQSWVTHWFVGWAKLLADLVH